MEKTCTICFYEKDGKKRFRAKHKNYRAWRYETLKELVANEIENTTKDEISFELPPKDDQREGWVYRNLTKDESEELFSLMEKR